MADVRELGELVAEILTNKTIVTWDAVRHACRLMLAYADYNAAAADAKLGPPTRGDHPRILAAIDATFKEMLQFHADCERIWADYQAADWSPGAFGVWNASNDRFCAEIERQTRALEPLAEKHFGKALTEKHFGRHGRDK